MVRAAKWPTVFPALDQVLEGPTKFDGVVFFFGPVFFVSSFRACLVSRLFAPKKYSLGLSLSPKPPVKIHDFSWSLEWGINVPPDRRPQQVASKNGGSSTSWRW